MSILPAHPPELSDDWNMPPPGQGIDSTREPLVQVSKLRVKYRASHAQRGRSRSKYVYAVDGVSLEIYRGETVGLVGESGCGKSSIGRALVRLATNVEGSIVFDGLDLYRMGASELRSIRRRIQMIFQDPFGSLNPRMTVSQLVGEPLAVHGMCRGVDRRQRVEQMLGVVGLSAQHADRYPHSFSGGQRQRIGIARALASEPDFIVADEAVAALDVSIRAQVLNLLVELRERFSLTLLFISHDLSIVRHFADRVAVMYLGVLVEIARTDELFDHPLHPYTQALLSAVPVPDPIVEMDRTRIILEGELPSIAAPPSGCRFRTRCWKAQSICAEVPPELSELRPGHWVACHFPDLGV